MNKFEEERVIKIAKNLGAGGRQFSTDDVILVHEFIFDAEARRRRGTRSKAIERDARLICAVMTTENANGRKVSVRFTLRALCAFASLRLMVP